MSSARIELASGRVLDLANPAEGLIDIEDIAHALSHLCRFTGHTREFYSVAEHAVLVARLLEWEDYLPVTCLHGLHHDDQEAFLGDVSTPLKGLITGYAGLEYNMTRAVEKALGLPPLYEAGMQAKVKWADQVALGIEAKNLMPSEGKWLGTVPPSYPADLAPQCWSPEVAAHWYLEMHERLMADWKAH